MINTKMTSVILSLGLAFLLTACDKSGSQEESSVEPTEAERVADTVTNIDTTAETQTTTAMDTTTEQLEKPILVANMFSKFTASVVSLDLETRVAVLRDADGNEQTIKINEESRNLDQVSVGDTVIAESMEQISVYLVDGLQEEPAKIVAEVASRSDVGEMPSASKIKKSIEIYNVAAIDLENNSFSLQDATGNITSYAAQNPENLKKASVGSKVVIEMSTIASVKVVKPE